MSLTIVTILLDASDYKLGFFLGQKFEGEDGGFLRVFGEVDDEPVPNDCDNTGKETYTKNMFLAFW